MGVGIIEVIGLFMRWVHMASAAVLIGGATYARLMVASLVEGLPPEDRPEAWAHLASRFRPLVYAAIAGLILSGIYGINTHRGHSDYYLFWLSVKLLLAAHVFAAAVLWVKTGAKLDDVEKWKRRAAGIAISGLAVLLVASYLRTIY